MYIIFLGYSAVHDSMMAAVVSPNVQNRLFSPNVAGLKEKKTPHTIKKHTSQLPSFNDIRRWFGQKYNKIHGTSHH